MTSVQSFMAFGVASFLVSLVTMASMARIVRSGRRSKTNLVFLAATVLSWCSAADLIAIGAQQLYCMSNGIPLLCGVPEWRQQARLIMELSSVTVFLTASLARADMLFSRRRWIRQTLVIVLCAGTLFVTIGYASGNFGGQMDSVLLISVYGMVFGLHQLVDVGVSIAVLIYVVRVKRSIGREHADVMRRSRHIQYAICTELIILIASALMSGTGLNSSSTIDFTYQVLGQATYCLTSRLFLALGILYMMMLKEFVEDKSTLREESVRSFVVMLTVDGQRSRRECRRVRSERPTKHPLSIQRAR